MKTSCLKFQQRHIINDEFDFGREGEVGIGDPDSFIQISISIGKHVKIFCSKFQQNRTINEEFELIEE